MKKIIILLFVFCSGLLYAQAPVISNVSFSQRTDGSLIVDVYYDVDDMNLMNITLTASDDGGSTWDLNCSSVSGDVGSAISKGTNKHIVWDFYADNPGISGSNFMVRVTAQDYLETGTMTDQDGNVYATVKIGEKWWMAEDLRVTTYRNGDPIPHVTDNAEWSALSTGAYCYYNNDSDNAAVYGAMYNWYAVVDPRNLAPEGWRVPSDYDYKVLEMSIGLTSAEANSSGASRCDDGGKLKEEGTSHWNTPNTSATNESGFRARGGGYRYDANGAFYSMNYGARYWTSTHVVTNVSAFTRELSYLNDDIIRSYDENGFGLSVRLVKE